MTQQPSESVPINDGRYGAHWGLSDLYPDSLTRLKGALSGGDMRTDWWGSRKEIAWARVRRENGHVTVDVRSQMDSSDELLHGAYLTLTAPPSPVRASIEPIPVQPRRPTRVKYQCQTCQVQVWGKPGLNVACLTCNQPLSAAQD